MKKIFFIRLLIMFVIVFALTPLAKSQPNINIQLTELEKTKGEKKVLQYKEIASMYSASNKYSEAIEYLQKGIEYAEHEKLYTSISLLCVDLANLFSKTSDAARASNATRKGLAYWHYLNDLNAKIEIYLNVGVMYVNNSVFDSASFYFNKTANLIPQSSITISKGKLYFFMGALESRKQNNNLAIEYYNKSLTVFKQIHDLKWEAKAMTYLSGAYRFSSKYDKAIASNLEASRILLKLNNKYELASCYMVQAMIYNDIEDFNNATIYQQKALAIFNELNLHGYEVGSIYDDMAVTYTYKKEYDKALHYRLKSLDLFKKSGQTEAIAGSLKFVGADYLRLGKYAIARDYVLQSKVMFEELKDTANFCDIFLKLGQIYSSAPDAEIVAMHELPEGKYNTSIAYFKQALKIAQDIEVIDYQRTIWNELSAVYEKQHDYPNAFEAYKKYKNINDSIFNDDNRSKIDQIIIENKFVSQTDSIKLIQLRTSTNLAKQEFLNKQQKQNLRILNNEKELQHLAFLKTQAELQTEQLQKNEKERLLILSQNEKQLQTTQIKSLFQSNELNKFRQRQTIFFSLIALAALGIIGIYFFNRNKHKQKLLETELIKQQVLQQQKEVEFQKSISDLSVSALRSQMNPHFIFNCLNSIKLFTTQNNNEAAANYLTKFSKLIRMALENSRSETVTLQSDLDSLELYIQLEAMRFKEKLKYTLIVDENVDADFIEIPPMLLQPYVENAIWHGLMQKDEGGKIEIRVMNDAEKLTLIITIKDNGIGRKMAALLSDKKSNNHKSFGSKATQERIELINKTYDTEASVFTEDVLIHNQVQGTLVTIKIPYE